MKRQAQIALSAMLAVAFIRRTPAPAAAKSMADFGGTARQLQALADKSGDGAGNLIDGRPPERAQVQGSERGRSAPLDLKTQAAERQAGASAEPKPAPAKRAWRPGNPLVGAVNGAKAGVSKGLSGLISSSAGREDCDYGSDAGAGFVVYMLFVIFIYLVIADRVVGAVAGGMAGAVSETIKSGATGGWNKGAAS